MLKPMPAPGPGDLLGGCRIEETIGRGGMGVVYRAHQDDLERDVAIKVIAPELPRRRGARASGSCARRAPPRPSSTRTWSRSTSAGEIDGDRAYIVMRYVDGRRPAHARAPRRPARARARGRDRGRLGDALDAIHRAGYVHRDVKPANVLIDRRRPRLPHRLRPRQAALARPARREPGRWVGTLDFAAPEQIRGGAVDARADVYALGGVLHFMLTGRVAVRPRAPTRPGVGASVRARRPCRRRCARGCRPRSTRSWRARWRRTRTTACLDRGDSAAPRWRRCRAIRRSRRRPRGPRRAAAGAPSPRLPGSRARRRRAGGLALLGPDEPAERASTAPRPAGTPAPPVRRSGRRRAGSATGRAASRSRAVRSGAEFAASNLARLDPETLEKAGPQPRIGKEAMSVAGRGRDLWVAIPRRGQVLRLDAASGRVEGRITPPQTPLDVELGSTAPSGSPRVAR